MAFTSASGDLMPNLGQKILLVKTPAGHVRVMRNQVVNCTGALTATSRLVDEDNFVGHSPEGSFIFDMKTGEFDLLERKDDCFELGLETIPYSEAASILKDMGLDQGFQRRSR